MKKTILVILLISMLLTVSCSSSREEITAQEPAESYDNGGVATESVSNRKGQENTPLGNKIIKSGSAVIVTESFDELTDRIISKTLEIGGYIEYSFINDQNVGQSGYLEPRDGTFVLRIPTIHFESFIGYLDGYGKVVREQFSAEDISDKYFDSESHLRSLRIQEERLLALLEKEGSLEDLLKIERELTSVRYEIEGYTGELKKWDKLISLSTLEINVREVDRENEIINAPATFSGELLESVYSGTDGLIRFLKGSLLVFLANWPIMIVLVLIVYFNRRRILKLLGLIKEEIKINK